MTFESPSRAHGVSILTLWARDGEAPLSLTLPVSVSDVHDEYVRESRRACGASPPPPHPGVPRRRAGGACPFGARRRPDERGALMPYDPNDPRSQLGANPHRASDPPERCFAPQYFEFGKLDPDEVTAARHAVVVRAQPELLRRVLRAAGGRRSRTRPASPTSTWCCSAARCRGRHDHRGRATRPRCSGATVVRSCRPGRARSRSNPAGVVVRLFSTAGRGPARRCRNADVYADARSQRRAVRAVARSAGRPPHPRLPARRHPARTAAASAASCAAARSWSTTSIPTTGRATRSKLSPHHHDDFEQISLQLDGRLRAPHPHAVDGRTSPTGATTTTSSAPAPPSPSSRRRRSTPARASSDDAPPADRHLLPAARRLLRASRAGC